MADIELVIKIPEEIYKASKIVDVQYEDVVQIPLEVIANGTLIPDNEPLCENCHHVKVCGDLTRAWCKKERNK